MHKGEVWQVKLPFTDGREQADERPVIIIQDDTFTQVLPMILVVPLTSVIAAARFVATLNIQPNEENGLSVLSIALIFQARSLDKRRFLRRIGCIDSQTMDQVLTLLDHLTGR